MAGFHRSPSGQAAIWGAPGAAPPLQCPVQPLQRPLTTLTSTLELSLGPSLSQLRGRQKCQSRAPLAEAVFMSSSDSFCPTRARPHGHQRHQTCRAHLGSYASASSTLPLKPQPLLGQFPPHVTRCSSVGVAGAVKEPSLLSGLPGVVLYVLPSSFCPFRAASLQLGVPFWVWDVNLEHWEELGFWGWFFFVSPLWGGSWVQLPTWVDQWQLT